MSSTTTVKGHEVGDVLNRETAIRALAESPMYQLSTAGMELFHTNVLYWLARQHPEESAPLWNALGLRTPWGSEPAPFIRREWRHLDLVISEGLGQQALILENKIGAIPTAEQLKGYRNSVGSHIPAGAGVTTWVLLTLTRPSFDIPDPWTSITYGELLPSLRETAQRLPADDGVLMVAYATMVERLDAVAGLYDPALAPGEQVRLTPDERELLIDARLLSLVEKVRAGRFAEQVTKEIRDALGSVPEVGAGLSNGSGVNSWWIPGPRGRQFGWQLQGGQFRLVVITGSRDRKKRSEREALVQSLYASFFDFTVVEGVPDILTEYTGRKDWLGYEPNFVYRYASLTPDATWAELRDLAVWFSGRTTEFVRGLGKG
ncbi:PD-(D/E)XK nuclease family protein [Ornithinimicrobium faecis]|uniref:PD-(D/E)XK nuclease family protein n=1 Tax=Ornithinimicrobium faecis TaxID=2934158 RepID=A0ABY4YWS0_9MICO|nr:PD-(D/E)XK nuclease family protein [Ornithinimicrobium sp. HY1793]USQ81190.1 PD-(D/E)XK nuclease family protein [Ornithinimicrobium sp. HY1793]